MTTRIVRSWSQEVKRQLESQVKRQLERLHQNIAGGPDGVSPRVLKACVEQLYRILQHIFNLSLSQENVPVLSWSFGPSQNLR